MSFALKRALSCGLKSKFSIKSFSTMKFTKSHEYIEVSCKTGKLSFSNIYYDS